MTIRFNVERWSDELFIVSGRNLSESIHDSIAIGDEATQQQMEAVDLAINLCTDIDSKIALVTESLLKFSQMLEGTGKDVLCKAITEFKCISDARLRSYIL